MSAASRRLGIMAVVVSVLTAGSATTAGAQTEAAADQSSIVTREVAPSVERIIRDGAGHALQRKYPNEPRDIDRVAVGPDGTVWIASTAHGDDNQFLDGFQVWPLGQRGIYGTRDGVPEYVESLIFMPDGKLWAIGSETARFDGQAWSSVESSQRAATSDGTLWLIARNDGVESWDGVDFKSHLPGSQIEGLFVDAEGVLWAVGPGTAATFDGEAWTPSRQSGQQLVAPDGAVWESSGNGVSRVLGDERTTYLNGLQINGIALAPDGVVWVAVGRGGADTGGLYRITPPTGG